MRMINRYESLLLLFIGAPLCTDAFSPLLVPTTKHHQSMSRLSFPTFSTVAARRSHILYQSIETKTIDVTISTEKSKDVTETEDSLDLTELQLTESTAVVPEKGFNYGTFAKKFPFINNLMIATAKTAAADLVAQTLIAQTPLMAIDLQRSFLFCLFGCLYLGAFQYFYQVQVFKKLFDVDKFTSQPWSEKIKDKKGLLALGAQTALDLTVLTFVYLPAFYIFKSCVFSGSMDPSVWFATGLESYKLNFAKDEIDLIAVWLPADLVCFSVPLYLRLPVRHIVSFVWTAYISFARGGH